MVSVKVVNDIIIDKSNYHQYSDCWYNQELDYLYYEYPFWFPAKLLIRNLEGDETEIVVNKWFQRLPSFMKGVNLTYLVREIELIKDLGRDILTIHGACVMTRDGQGILIVGLPNSGKTYKTLMWVKEGCSYIGDEYVKVSKNIATRVHTKCALSPYLVRKFGIDITLSQAISLKFRAFLGKLSPFLWEPIIWVDSDQVFKGKTLEGCAVDHIAFLDRKGDYSSGKKAPLTASETAKKIEIVLDNEFPFSSNYLLQVYSFLNPLFDLPFYKRKQRDLICELVEDVCEF